MKSLVAVALALVPIMPCVASAKPSVEEIDSMPMSELRKQAQVERYYGIFRRLDTKSRDKDGTLSWDKVLGLTNVEKIIYLAEFADQDVLLQGTGLWGLITRSPKYMLDEIQAALEIIGERKRIDLLKQARALLQASGTTEQNKATIEVLCNTWRHLPGWPNPSDAALQWVSLHINEIDLPPISILNDP